jgi:succinate dehydrogenase/fumarate reductase flavoprotein subunit
MIAQEARTLIPIYHTYNQAGFDPDKDMLQHYNGSWLGVGIPQWRDGADGGGLVTDWDLRTSLEGLYAAGGQLFASGDHAYAASTGRYAGRKAADYAAGAKMAEYSREQADAEKARVYAPVRRENGMDWKELNAGVCRVMQDYCGEIKNEELLKIGLTWLDELDAGEFRTAFARNPHELSRMLEVFNIATVGRMIFEACRSRRASNPVLGFFRTDFPEADPSEWHKWVTVKQAGGQVTAGSLPLDFYGDMPHNYASHNKDRR